MPVFQEDAHSDRDLRIRPSRARPLPRLTPHTQNSQNNTENFEVVVIGAGPSGLFLTLLLARYGLTSLACFDAKPGTLKAGQADGLQPRTLEVLKSLGIADEILNDGCHMSEVAFWNEQPMSPASNGLQNGERGGIKRTSFAPDVNVPARYQHEVTIHQGRIERIMQEDLRLYANESTIQRSHHFLDFKFQEDKKAEFPIEIELEERLPGGRITRKTVHAKYLVGADGAHSRVRQSMDLNLEGETTDHIWGVVDFVAETDFPDIRKRCAIHSDAGSVMVIPRERIASGQYLTRLYVQVADEVLPDTDISGAERLKRTNTREKRAAITLDYIFTQARRVFSPYTIEVKRSTTVDWWAAYQIGQRMTPRSSAKGPDDEDRVFIVGDACHTHSPKAGQGMNVSMMDSYNLSWKLVHTIHGLTPPSPTGTTDPILTTFETERLGVARQLIEFDSKFSSMFSGQMGGSSLETGESLTHEEFLKVFSNGSGFTSGCGIEYGDSIAVKHQNEATSEPIVRHEPHNGTLTPGRRLLDVKVIRHADANLRHLQDGRSPPLAETALSAYPSCELNPYRRFPSTGVYRILVLTSTDIFAPTGTSSHALSKICTDIIPCFPEHTVELVVLQPLKQRVEWTDIPACVKYNAEMSFHGLSHEDAYDIYGVSKDLGALVVVRPDGVVGTVAPLSESGAIEGYLSGCLVARLN